MQEVFWANHQILNWIPRTIPEFTDHGILHSTNVVKYLIKINENCTPFNQHEKFILSLASLLHDIGCLIDRDKHNYISVNMLENESSDLKCRINEEDFSSLCQVILSHKKDYDLRLIFEDRQDDVDLKKICPLFRLSDASDIGKKRISDKIFKLMKNYDMLSEKSKTIWESHLAINDIDYEKSTVHAYVNDLVKSEYCLNDFMSELDIINKYYKHINNPTLDLKVNYKKKPNPSHTKEGPK